MPDDAEEFLLAPVIARGRAHSLVAPAKVGKSLLLLNLAVHIATGKPILNQPAGKPTRVLYLDFEMTEHDVRDRLASMGFGPDDDLDALIYYSLPSLPPLDTPQGGERLVQLARDHNAELVVIDTLSRTIAGEENDAKPFQNFAMYVGLPLKAAGIAYVRADHMGKDPTKGERGNSAKRDDVDVAWKLTKRDRGYFTLDHGGVCRVSWMPEKVELRQETEPVTRYHVVSDSWLAGTTEMAAKMDALGLPTSCGREAALKALRGEGIQCSTNLAASAVRWRKQGGANSLADVMAEAS